MYFYYYWNPLELEKKEKYKELNIIKTHSLGKDTLSIQCENSNNKKIELRFVKIKGLPMYEFTFKGDLDLEKLEIKTNQFYTTESEIKKFSPVDCGDFDG